VINHTTISRYGEQQLALHNYKYYGARIADIITQMRYVVLNKPVGVHKFIGDCNHYHCTPYGAQTTGCLYTPAILDSNNAIITHVW